MTQTASHHVTADTLLTYFEGHLDDERMCGVEEHLAGCDACAALAQGLQVFEEAWRMPAAALAEGLERALLADGLAAADVGSPALHGRLAAWASRWAVLAEGAVRVAVESTGAAVRVIADGLDTLARPGSGWQFSPVAASVSVRGVEDDDVSSAVLATPAGTGHPRALVAVRGGAQTEIDVRIEGLAPHEAPPLVVLIERQAGAAPRAHVAALEARPGLGCHVARFTGLADGEYVLAVEPLTAPPR